VCARSLTKSFFRPSQPGTCAWLSPFLLCADCTHSVITHSIAVRTITAVMEILDIAGPIPRHIFQLSSRQVSSATSSQSAYANPFFYIHNNLCDSYYNPDETYASCLTPFAGTLLSTYTSNQLRQIKLSPLENSLLINSNVLQQLLHIDRTILSLSATFMCPKNMLTERMDVCPYTCVCGNECVRVLERCHGGTRWAHGCGAQCTQVWVVDTRRGGGTPR